MNHASSIPGLEPIHQGKVRDTFKTAIPGALLLVATDRISTHNVVHESLVPLKGQVLTALSVFWAREICDQNALPHHILASGEEIYDFLPTDRSYPEDLHLRAIVVAELRMAPIEFIFRRRMAGSLWSEYYSKGIPNPYGLDLPEGLEFMSPLEPAIFTPTDKSETDDPLNANAVRSTYEWHFDLAEALYRSGVEYALRRGIDIIDTKIEIGVDQYGDACIGDEFLTPDSSRFVQVADIVVGKEPLWADKQVVRDEVVRLWGGKKKGPKIAFSKEIIDRTTETYLRVFHQLTGMSLGGFQEEHL